MKSNLLLLIVSVMNLVSFSMSAQNIKRCGTMEALKIELNRDSGLHKQMTEVENRMQNWIKGANSKGNLNEIITIPFVVHVVYRTDEENISDERVYEQIEVLNRDFRNHNEDGNTVPEIFQLLRADTRIQFCLARRDPHGNPTNGIERLQTDVAEFPINLYSSVKFTDQGGLDAWDNSKYLNIWVCNLVGNYLGFAQFPGGNPQTDGLVIDYEYFGISGTEIPFNMGRTAVHEIGHCFNLYHIWGDDENLPNTCSGTDYCHDTPNQEGPNYGIATYPILDNCTPHSPGVMFMNYMDYGDDAGMLMFTHDQANRIQACLNTVRLSLKYSDACQPPDRESIYFNKNSSVNYPNPADNVLNIDISQFSGNFELKIYNVLGNLLVYQTYNSEVSLIKSDVSKLEEGIYFVEIKNQEKKTIFKQIIKHNKTR